MLISEFEVWLLQYQPANNGMSTLSELSPYLRTPGQLNRQKPRCLRRRLLHCVTYEEHCRGGNTADTTSWQIEGDSVSKD